METLPWSSPQGPEEQKTSEGTDPKKNHLHSSQELKTRYCQTRTYAHQRWVLVGKEEEPVFHRLQLNSQSGTSDVAATD